MVHDCIGVLSSQNSVCEWNNTIGCANQVNRLLLEISQPGGEEFRTINRGAEEDEIYLGRQENKRLFPDSPALLVVDIMDLVKDNGVQIFKGERGSEAEIPRGGVVLEEEIAEDFRCHDDDIRLWLEFDIAGHDAHAPWPGLLEVMELLIGEGFDGGGVEDAATFGEAFCDLVFADERLSRARLRGDEDIFMSGNRCDGVLLERVYGEREGHRRCLWHSVTGCRGIYNSEIC